MSDISNLSDTIVPKSDQLNADQLLGGSMTITVTDVRRGQSDDQPVIVHYQGDEGRPYKPCKTMRKVLIFAWGPDGREWIGRSMSLYCDPQVRFGGAEVGGIRISHMTDIEKQIKVSLTATKGKKALHTIDPLKMDAGPTLASVLADIQKVKGQKGKAAAEQLIERLPFADQMEATEALAARIEALKGPQ